MHHQIAILACCLFMELASTSSLLAADDYQQLAEKSIEHYLAEHSHAAVTVGIVDAHGTHVFGFGQLKRDEPQSRPDGKTIYQIGSITKTFTCTLLAEQVVLGHMKLDDPAQKYLPADLVLPREKDREITLEELATHHSGLPRLPQLASFFMLGGALAQNPYAGNRWEDMPTIMRTVWLSTAIGKEYAYSNLGMGLLGQAVVHAAKSENYATLIHEHISKPLGMPDTVIDLDDQQASRLAQGYNALGQMAPDWKFASLEGCGALYSTTDDLLTYASANLGLKSSPLAEAMKLAQEPRPKYPWSGGAMGLGWHEFEYHGIPMIWHNGMTGGYTSMVALLPTKKLGIVMLSNSVHSIDPYTYVLIDLLFPQTKPE
jgi:CubicO group peptidase (beta-lactamase class C family)